MKTAFLAAACLVSFTGGAAEGRTPGVPGVGLADSDRRLLLEEFVALLRIPNVASDRADMRRNADAIAGMMRRRGLGPRLLADPGFPDAPPVVFGEWRVPGATRTLVLYAHYDGQPVVAGEWREPPWSATLRAPDAPSPIAASSPEALGADVRILGRGGGDDKGGVVAILGALDAIRGGGRKPAYNIKIVFEGEEEAGSPHLAAILQANRTLLAGNLWLVCDGPTQPTTDATLTYGVRGDMNVDLTVFGPARALHSGHYGNWAPNPGLRLAGLLAAMKDERGRVLVDGWYDEVAPLGARERAAVAEAARAEPGLRRELGVAEPERGSPLAMAVTEPSLNINGMRSGRVGADAANVIPERAEAVLDVRLVPGQTPRSKLGQLAAFVRARGYAVVDHDPTAEERFAHPLIARLGMRPGAYAGVRTPMDDPLARRLSDALRSAMGSSPPELVTSGGSLPLSVITEALGTRALVFSFANHDDNQHAADEFLRLGNLWRGIALLAAMLEGPQRSVAAHPRGGG